MFAVDPSDFLLVCVRADFLAARGPPTVFEGEVVQLDPVTIRLLHLGVAASSAWFLTECNGGSKLTGD